MPKRSKSRPVEELNLTYRRRSQDIEEVYSEMFNKPAAPVVPFPAPPGQDPEPLSAGMSAPAGTPELNSSTPNLATPNLTSPNLDPPAFNEGVVGDVGAGGATPPVFNEGVPAFVTGESVLNKDTPELN